MWTGQQGTCPMGCAAHTSVAIAPSLGRIVAGSSSSIGKASSSSSAASKPRALACVAASRPLSLLQSDISFSSVKGQESANLASAQENEQYVVLPVLTSKTAIWHTEQAFNCPSLRDFAAGRTICRWSPVILAC
ncbi:hypothetical protein LHGZ1_2473 [Laribacter hongkongensis]|uniref:Uncharacterized protein n=1 Tax=Laribacter hongkongensis TaxID=168471 RepID=A0A248LLH8_9NEIS|nr:hypothetical protein LHGZ1_2473 [Laribacter hongkongensis]